MVTTDTRPAHLGTGLTNPDDPRHPQFLARLRENLRSAASEMARAQCKRDQERQRRTELERQLGDLTADLQSDVALALTEAGKPLFSNAESRAAELRRRLSSDASAQALQQSIDACDVVLAECAQEFDTAHRGRQDALAVMAFSAQWLSYWGNQTTE